MATRSRPRSSASSRVVGQPRRGRWRGRGRRLPRSIRCGEGHVRLGPQQPDPLQRFGLDGQATREASAMSSSANSSLLASVRAALQPVSPPRTRPAAGPVGPGPGRGEGVQISRQGEHPVGGLEFRRHVVELPAAQLVADQLRQLPGAGGGHDIEVPCAGRLVRRWPVPRDPPPTRSTGRRRPPRSAPRGDRVAAASPPVCALRRCGAPRSHGSAGMPSRLPRRRARRRAARRNRSVRRSGRRGGTTRRRQTPRRPVLGADALPSRSAGSGRRAGHRSARTSHRVTPTTSADWTA